MWLLLLTPYVVAATTAPAACLLQTKTLPLVAKGLGGSYDQPRWKLSIETNESSLIEENLAKPHHKKGKKGVAKAGPPLSYQEAFYQAFLKGDAELVALATGIGLTVALILFEVMHIKYSDVDFEEPFKLYSDTEREQETAVEGPFAGTLRLWQLYLVNCKEMFAFCVTFIGIMIWLNQYTNLLLVNWQNTFWGELQAWNKAGDEGHMIQVQIYLLQFLFYAFISLFAGAYQDYVTSMFIIKVRSLVSRRYTSEWLSSYSYYRLELCQSAEDSNKADNPDQRIQEDVLNFISTSVNLLTSVVNAVAQFFIFAAKVYYASPPDAFGITGLQVPGWLLYVSLTYGISSAVVTFRVSRALEALTSVRQRTEADFRYELYTVRRNSESIALTRSESAHAEWADQRFNVLVRGFWETMLASRRFSICSSFWLQVEVVLPFLFLSPAILSGKMHMGQLMSISNCMSLFDQSCLWYTSNYDSIASWQASTGRLVRFETAIAKHAREVTGGALMKSSSDACVKVEKMSIWTPSAAVQEFGHSNIYNGTPEKGLLFENLTMDFPPGSRVLLAGPSGTGKSTFLRAISGAWPFASGEVSLPDEPEKALFFPVEVFVPSGDLRSAVTYPCLQNGETKEPYNGPSDEEIEETLRLVGLEMLLEGGLEQEGDWGLSLSSGQKARLNLARLILQKPQVAALDEPVAHLQPDQRAPLLKRALDALGDDAVVFVVSHELSQDVISLFNQQLEVDTEAKVFRKKV